MTAVYLRAERIAAGETEIGEAMGMLNLPIALADEAAMAAALKLFPPRDGWRDHYVRLEDAHATSTDLR